MSVTRIPIDGLWRCLCPSIDAIGYPSLRSAKSSLRTSTRLPIASKRSHPPRIRYLSTSAPLQRWPKTQNEYQLDEHQKQLRESLTASAFNDDQHRPHTPFLPIHDKTPPPPKTNYDELDKLTIPELHDHLRKIRTEERSYFVVTDLVEYLIMNRGEEPSLVHYDSLIRANADAAHGSADIVRGLLEEMRSFGIRADSSLYHGTLQALAIHPDYILREQVLKEMKEKWFGLSPEGWHYLVVGLIRDKQFEVAMDKLEEMNGDGVRVQPWLYDIYTFQLCEARELDEVFRLLEFRWRNFRGDIAGSVWYYLLEKFSADLHYQGTRFIWEHYIEGSNINPSDGICVNVLNVAARYADPQLATSVIKILSERRFALSPFHYEALLEAYAGDEDLLTSLRVLTIMTKAGLFPDASTTRPLFHYLMQSPQYPAQAWKDLEELSIDGHAVPVAAVNVILEATIQLGLTEEAVNMYKQLHKICKTGPNTETFNTLLQGTSKQSKPESMFLASEMRALGVKPNSLTYDRLICSCLLERDYEDAFLYLEEMVRSGGEEDGGWWMRLGTATALVRKCVEGDDGRAWGVLEDMERRGMPCFKVRNMVEEHWAGRAMVEGKERQRTSEEKLRGWGNVV